MNPKNYSFKLARTAIAGFVGLLTLATAGSCHKQMQEASAAGMKRPPLGTHFNIRAVRDNSLAFTKPMVWANLSPQGLSLHAPYGELFPLDLRRTYLADEEQSRIAAAKQEGIDGFWVVTFEDVKFLDKYLAGADAVGGFSIAPMIDVNHFAERKVPESQIVDIIVTNITQYASLAANHPSAAREQGKLVVTSFQATAISPAAWQTARQRLQAKGISVYLMLDLAAHLHQHTTLPSELIKPYLPVADAHYSFDVKSPQFFDKTVKLMKENQHPFAGGIMPGYGREVVEGIKLANNPNAVGGYRDALGTEAYRSDWEQHLSNGLTWVAINTSNDMVEHTEVMPDSDWNYTRADLTAWYAAKLKGRSAPFREPRLYVTTPQALHSNESSLAEALAINPTDHAVTVRIQIFDGVGRLLASAEPKQVPANSVGAVTLPLNYPRPPAKGFVRAHASLAGGQEQLISVVSAPTLLFSSAGIGSAAHLFYYSIPSNRALPEAVRVSVSGGQATVTPPGTGDVKYVELLHNAQQAKQFFDQGPFTVDIPSGTHKIIGGQVIDDNDPAGFYVGRVIDGQGRVGYSDPVIVNRQ